VRLSSTRVEGVLLVDADAHEDERGSFFRAFDAEVFAAAGLPTHFPQHSISTNRRRGTLRGLHWQRAPQAEAKLVRCVRGSIFDVAVDLRPESRTYRQWTGVELRAAAPAALFIPPGCAHGFQTLEDDSDVLYLISVPYQAGAAEGVRWDDPSLSVAWPLTPLGMSDRDRSLPYL
jgi:dTDP-4-dehydrorhamnose 3,5-epimerase